MSWARDLKPGDEVYVACRERRLSDLDSPRKVLMVAGDHVIVETHGRYDVERLHSVNGQWPDSRLWRSADECRNHYAATELVIMLRNALGYTANNGVTPADVVKAAELLGIELGDSIREAK